MHLADAFIQSDLQLHSGYIFISMCSWESNPQPFALLMQCSTQSHTGTHDTGKAARVFQTGE